MDNNVVNNGVGTYVNLKYIFMQIMNYYVIVINYLSLQLSILSLVQQIFNCNKF